MFGRKREPSVPPPDPSALTRDHVVWAYRLILDRDPEDDAVIGPKLAGSRSTKELRTHLMTSGEYQEKNPDFAHTNDSTIVIKELDGPGSTRLFVDLSDHVIGLGIVRGHYERDEAAYVKSVLRAGDSAIDVGAHIGFFAMQMAALVGPTGQVVAFEPFARNADLLEQSRRENRFEERLQVYRAAVADRSGTATLTFPAETLNTGGAYLLHGGTAPLAGNRTGSVPVVALDDLVAERRVKRPVRLIKMDAEGAEPQVIRGARRLLADDRPTILSELHPEQLMRASGITAAAFLAELSSLGYAAFHLEGGRQGAPLERAPDEAMTSVLFVAR